ncbi:FAD-dependent pyridine nucleotide-disulphide oxidoreductase [Methylocella silvestris BL2]|uniref:FAD-dependent pyridine nucleotide-disulphide oxidoreductase n=1 Tax=Methylocella silvestris (strain DSM 15510 / CIP 108128 / LMG 27833 / NCIMB 13906 / BL2) TaxID=395965 RepID=B8EQB4_METSB|nr:FAD-dependent oxidoreductase [Methylocella silvestris]ACK52127.1 FAD-dependent pyridine nucleotide-disulphide oxidoreductase [Methylocella silvestris BL2]
MATNETTKGDGGRLDFNHGVDIEALRDGQLIEGEYSGKTILVLRRGEDIRVFRGTCTHLGAPLSEGLLSGDRLRCPWHQACFDIKTGEATAAPAFAALKRFDVRREGEMIHLEAPQPAAPVQENASGVFVIIGGGAAGFAAADMLCRHSAGRGVTLVSEDQSPPYERTLLTKDFLDGSWDDPRINLGAEPLDRRGVTLQLGAKVARVDRDRHVVRLDDGRELSYQKLLLAPGAAPRWPDFPGARLPQTHVLRTLADCQAIVAAAKEARRVVILGSSFIGLEAAASLRARGLEVDVVSQDTAPMQRVFGPEISTAMVATHRKNGVRLHLGRQIKNFDGAAATLDDGANLPADFLLIGIGVTPRLDLAEEAGLTVEKGVVVDQFLTTSDPDIFAAGDVAAWPDPHSGQRLRVEHWNVAVRQGQVAAQNMLGGEIPYRDVPFFWTRQFDFSPLYLGHATEWDEIKIDGDIERRDCAVRYIRAGRVMASVMIGRERECLEERERMERALAGS